MQQDGADQVSNDERLERLSQIISARSLEGWNVVDRNDREVYAVLMMPGKPVNHVLHAILTLFTCLIWGIVWGVMVGTQKREQRVRLSIDAQGHLVEETVTVG
jgi:hypothetical protein